MTSPIRLCDGKKRRAQSDADQQRGGIAPQAGVEGNPDRHGRGNRARALREDVGACPACKEAETRLVRATGNPAR
jgi:hypothetical protein